MTFSTRPSPVADVDIYADGALEGPYQTYHTLGNAIPAVRLTSHPVRVIDRYADVRGAIADATAFSSVSGIGISEEMNALQPGSVLGDRRLSGVPQDPERVEPVAA